MKKLIFSILIIFLCLTSFMLISCGGEDDTTTAEPPITYSITYELNGGINSADNPSTYSEGGSFDLAIPTKEDYMFAGWFTDPEFKNFVTEIKANSVGDITLYAKWIVIEGYFSFELIEDSYCITGGPKAFFAHLYIPSTYKGLPVTSIGDDAFEKHDNIVYVYIPDSVTRIGSCAFFQCKSLNGIRFSNNLKKISLLAFAGCESLTSIDLPDSLTHIYSSAFSSTGLTSVDIPFGVTVIEYQTFSSCDSLVEVKLPQGLTTIGFDAFLNCTALEKIVIPSSVTKIDRTIFNGCSSLKEITVEEGNTAYKSVDGVLYTKDGKTLVEYPGKKTEKEFDIPYGTEVIGERAFYLNPYIVNINIPSSVKNIGRIIGCTALESIELPESVEKIDGFLACSSLKNITLSSNIEAIPTYAFQDCTSLESIVIPNGIKKLGNWVFYRCTSLESVVIPKSVTDIEYSIFEGCTSINKIYCEAESKPDGWDNAWNRYDVDVVWGHEEGHSEE